MIKKPTLKDVAKEAGVAPATVSAILNEKEYCWASEETRQVVRDAAAKVGYVVNRAARNMRYGHSRTVGIILPDIINPVNSMLANLLEAGFMKQGYHVVIEYGNHNYELERQALEDVFSWGVDGVVAMLSFSEEHTAVLEQKSALGMPIIMLGGVGQSTQTMGVSIDFLSGTRQACQHLRELGHSSVGAVLGSAEQKIEKSRFGLFSQCAQEAGLTLDSQFAFDVGNSIENAYLLTREKLKEWGSSRPTALICRNDFIAMGAMRGAIDTGLQVPGDLSIIGMDGIFLNRYLPVQLTSVSLSFDRIAELAVKFFMTRVSGKPIKTRVKTVSTKLIVGESTGPAGTQ